MPRFEMVSGNHVGDVTCNGSEGGCLKNLKNLKSSEFSLLRVKDGCVCVRV